MKEWSDTQFVQCATDNPQNAMVMNMIKITKKQYIAPKLTQETYKTEMGYVGSNLVNINLDQLMLWRNDDPVEPYDNRSGWEASDENNHFWD